MISSLYNSTGIFVVSLTFLISLELCTGKITAVIYHHKTNEAEIVSEQLLYNQKIKEAKNQGNYLKRWMRKHCKAQYNVNMKIRVQRSMY